MLCSPLYRTNILYTSPFIVIFHIPLNVSGFMELIFFKKIFSPRKVSPFKNEILLSVSQFEEPCIITVFHICIAE